MTYNASTIDMHVYMYINNVHVQCIIPLLPAEVKRVGDTLLGVATHVKVNNVVRPSPQTASRST